MVELIAVIILMGSIFGMAIILFRKIPLIKKLPETAGGLSFETKISKIKGKIKKIKYSESPSFEILLQKVLSKIRILSLKTEKKTSSWLQRLREKSIKKKENDKYWQKLKTSIQEEKETDKENNDLPV
jgi:hypothetical protein